MEYGVGVALALAAGAWLAGLDRERGFCPAVLIDDPGVPPWSPGFCLGYDAAAAAVLAARLSARATPARA